MVGGVLIVISVTVLILAPILWQDAAAQLGFVDLPAFELGPFRSLIGVAFVLLLLSALYGMLPGRRPPWKAILPGALLTLVLWGAAAASFTLYLGHFNNYDITYGSLGGVVIAMIFFYLLGAVFLFGAEINAAIGRQAGAQDTA